MLPWEGGNLDDIIRLDYGVLEHFLISRIGCAGFADERAPVVLFRHHLFLIYI